MFPFHYLRLNNIILGNEVSAANIKKVLDSVGVEADKEKIALVVKSLKGKNINELITEGQARLGSVPSGGAAITASVVVPAGAVEPAAVVEKKEEKKEEPEEESDDDMGFGLFD